MSPVSLPHHGRCACDVNADGERGWCSSVVSKVGVRTPFRVVTSDRGGGRESVGFTIWAFLGVSLTGTQWAYFRVDKEEHPSKFDEGSWTYFYFSKGVPG